MSKPLDRPYDPMTIENAVGLGLTGVILYCRKCRREAQARFDALALPLETPVPDIARVRRFCLLGLRRPLCGLPAGLGRLKGTRRGRNGAQLSLTVLPHARIVAG
jgi:hypothetical protein